MLSQQIKKLEFSIHIWHLKFFLAYFSKNSNFLNLTKDVDQEHPANILYGEARQHLRWGIEWRRPFHHAHPASPSTLHWRLRLPQRSEEKETKVFMEPCYPSSHCSPQDRPIIRRRVAGQRITTSFGEPPNPEDGGLVPPGAVLPAAAVGLLLYYKGRD